MKALLVGLCVIVTTATASPVDVETGDQASFSCHASAVRTLRRPVEALTGRAGAVVVRGVPRIAIWGDSHTATHAFADALVAAMKLDPAEVQPSFVAANWSIKGLAHPLREVCASPSWRHQWPASRARETGAGLSALSTEQAGSLLAFDFRWPAAATRLNSVRLHVSKVDARRTLVLGVSADGGPERTVTLPGALDVPLQLDFSRPVATLQLRLVAGQVTVHGLSPAYAQPGRHRLDVFSTPGATMAVWERAGVHSPTFAASRPDIDVAVLQYGTNDAPHIDGRLDDYLAALRSALRQFRVAYPGVRCVLIGPPDRGGQARGIDHSLLHTLVARAQQRVGREFDCDFWDWQAQMGGRGSAAAGVARTPPVMHRDRVHMTSLGYRDSGLAFGSWLMQHRL